MFQPTRPRGARHISQYRLLGSSSVSTHAPARGATDDFIPDVSIFKFQPTRPRGARRGCCWHVNRNWCFNPRAREGRDERQIDVSRHDQVSTHAPARGATEQAIKILADDNVSTHAPARGATRSNWRSTRRWRGFNPRAREGRDYSLAAPSFVTSPVSTHAPARGATWQLWRSWQRSNGFNPRAREGRDARPWCPWERCRGFNPRAREGRDDASARGYPGDAWFQSTRPRGARRIVWVLMQAIIKFQPTRPRGARLESAA